MTISATVIADSIDTSGKRITTFQLRYPRFIHAEFMTHRVFSRNAGSSRAIPVERSIQEIEQEIAKPVFWGQNRPGMQAVDEMSPEIQKIAENTWRSAAIHAVRHARTLIKMNAHKQIINRILEPFLHINVVVTATEWENFWGLRMHADAAPEIQALAKAMYAAQQASTPQLLKSGWHLPYFIPDQDDKAIDDFMTFQYGPRDPVHGWYMEDVTLERLRLQISVARCARVSYKAFDGTVSPIEKDIELYNKLVGSQPLHASPLEHQACPDIYGNHKHLWGNFVGWRQFRKMIPGEDRAPFQHPA